MYVISVIVLFFKPVNWLTTHINNTIRDSTANSITST